jgi:hypothetical protein
MVLSQRMENYGTSSRKSQSLDEKERIGRPLEIELTSSRDNPTVSRRVLALADSLGEKLGKQSASLELVLKGGGGDVFTTKTVKLSPLGPRL